MKRLKDIYKYLQGRYGEMGTLFLVCLVIALMCLFNIMELAENVQSAESDKYLAWIYVCNLACLFVISVQMLRLDCRRLLSLRTAGILDTCGTVVLILMVVRHKLEKHVAGISPDEDNLYWQDTIFVYLLGFILLFIGRLVRRAAKLKEEQDLTI